ncbi:ATP-grasp domain-containing protein [Inconstantimicrobium porci]|uniref:RimK-like protein n=1 Tax=Inconstantimicrobium porci TaxID=2652291 RepID=A0A7X2N076_9CLOT|nr:RimK-like protein [Inconstantimicrobium porci]MSR92321.1 RimK-like protein [Inconstantimicrobium porci]
MNRVDYLVIADTKDFTSDYITIELRKRERCYLRINRDKFSEYSIQWDIFNEKMIIEIEKERYYIDSQLKGVYYRAPVYLRFYSQNSYEEQLYKSQWMAFVKNLICFENAVWINNPVDTYKAENKMLQLKYAKELGFTLPKTLVVNSYCNNIDINKKYAIKSIDTLLLRNDEEECFLYTNIVSGKELKSASLSMAPVVVQELINPKVDLRITVIGDIVYAVKIVKDGEGINQDWRKEKDDVKFEVINLPDEISEKCIKLVRKLGLRYGAIDMAVSNGKYYFIEINPTGEWAWLVESSGLKIYKDIVNTLEKNKEGVMEF